MAIVRPFTEFGTPSITLGTAASIGSAVSVVRTDATIVVFDATVPSTQTFGNTASTGTVAYGARRDHKHAWPAAPVVSDYTIADSAFIPLSLETGTAGTVDLSFSDIIYCGTARTWWKADADGTATAIFPLGIVASSSISAGSAGSIMRSGYIRSDAVFGTVNYNLPQYLSTSAGSATTTAPSGSGNVVRTVGYLRAPYIFYFDPSNVWIVHA